MKLVILEAYKIRPRIGKEYGLKHGIEISSFRADAETLDLWFVIGSMSPAFPREAVASLNLKVNMPLELVPNSLDPLNPVALPSRRQDLEVLGYVWEDDSGLPKVVRSFIDEDYTKVCKALDRFMKEDTSIMSMARDFIKGHALKAGMRVVIDG